MIFAPLALALLAALPLPAAARHGDEPYDAAYPGAYMGGNLGWASGEIDEASIARHLARSGLTMTSIDTDESDIGVKLFGGYRFHKYFALEAGFFDLSEVGFTARTSPPGTLTGTMTVQGVSLDPVLMIPIAPRLSTLLRVGVNYHETDTTYTATGSASAPPSRTSRSTKYKYGAGLQYDFSAPLSLRFEAEHYRIDDAVGNDGDMQLFSLGLIYHFWSKPAPPPAPAPAAAPPPVVAYREPVLVVVPAPRTEEYCSILDIAFEINLVEIQREEKERLAVVGTFLTKYPKATAVIEGHTDDVGSDEDNLTLSQRRAESVVAYLIETFRIAPSRLQAVGYGETRPLVDNDSEEGKRLNRRIGAVIACAQDIEGLTVMPARITMAMDMEFELNKSDVRPQYHEELAKVARFLKANPTVTATVEGHTANLQGSPEQGMALSQARAQSVVNYLAARLDVPREQLSAEGFGKTRRFAYNTSAEGRQENRRVNIILNYPRR